jgi:glycosyltransferase involved in cell wall biosynthesis
MNLLLIDQFSEPGGAQLCLVDLLPGFLERGWKLRLMAPGTGRLVQEAAALGIPLDPLPIGRYGNGGKSAGDMLRFGIDMSRCAAAVRATVRRHAIDAIYVNGPRPLPAVSGTALPTIFHSHSVPGRWYARRLALHALHRSRASVLAVSRYVANSWPAPGRVRVVYTGVPDQRQAGGRRPAEGAVRLGIIGRIAPEKGHLDFVEAARMIRDAGRDVECAVYGAALFSDAAYERQVRRSSEGLPIAFHGWTNDVRPALARLDILAIPSRANEAAPRVALEALSAGVPVVAYGSGGIPELVEHGRSGILTVAAAPDALAAATIRLMDDPELRMRLGAGGRCSWERRFTLERYRREVCEAVEEAVCAPATSGRGYR